MMLPINKIYNGDCLEVMKDIDDKSVDLILTDPPYNASNSNLGLKGYKTINEEWDKHFNPYSFLDIAFKKIKKGGSILVFCSYHLLGKYLEYGKKVQQIIHWEYITAFPALAKIYTPVIEYVVWFSTPKYTFNKKEAIIKQYFRSKKAMKVYMQYHGLKEIQRKQSTDKTLNDAVRCTAQELSDTCGVSTRTIRRAANTLNDLGLTRKSKTNVGYIFYIKRFEDGVLAYMECLNKNILLPVNK